MANLLMNELQEIRFLRPEKVKRTPLIKKKTYANIFYPVIYAQSPIILLFSLGQ